MSYAQPLLLLGASGQLGSELRRLLDAASVPYLAPELDELDLTSPASLTSYLAAHQPRLIINAAAYTAVDKAASGSIISPLPSSLSGLPRRAPT